MVSRRKCVLGNLTTLSQRLPSHSANALSLLILLSIETLFWSNIALFDPYTFLTTLTQMMAKEQLWTFWCSMNPRHQWLIKHVRMAVRLTPHLVVKKKHLRHRPSVFTRSVTMPDPIHCDRPSALSIERISPSIAAGGTIARTTFATLDL